MTIIEVSHRHAAEARKGLAYLKELSATTDGWSFSSEHKDVKIYTRAVEGISLPIVRGDTVLEGDYTIEQVASVALAPGCRQIWDERFDGAEMREYFSHREALFYSKLKGSWPVSGRDIAGVSIRDTSEDVIYIAQSSVEDPKIPPVSSHTRAQLYISGWKISAVPNGVSLTYITHVDIKGSVPSAFIKMIQLQTPQCAGKVADYIKEHGHPPFVTGDLKGHLKREVFEHKKKEFIVELEGTATEEGLVKIEVGKALYPKGFKVKVHGEATTEESDGEKGAKHVVVSGVTSLVTITITPA
ncbi:hypothetical protein BC936DRAFT_148444 [Jimgerdemannia flammicorona]|uniref:START domain-containing protein n=1 Tax=Jimgerdemannia flammicorona TaxID=994334 RepID=A0A433D374_9FUNG|nr:hypothetical protein BC936DRAFT_148444 [Jimgerdemannia flammicorona]